jgi:DNA modification methylase
MSFSERILCDGKVRAVLGNSLEVMTKLAIKADLIFTDPPYNMSRKQAIKRPTAKTIQYFYGEWDSFENKDFFVFLEEFYKQTSKVLKEEGSVLTFTSTTWISYLRQIEEETGFYHKADLIWHKTNPVPQFRKMNYLSAHEMISWSIKNKKKFYFNFLTQNEMHNLIKGEEVEAVSEEIKENKEKKQGRKGAKSKKKSENKEKMGDAFFYEGSICMGRSKKEFSNGWRHPTQKPLWLIRELAKRHCKEEAVVLDPFAGSGTTAIGLLQEKPKIKVVLIENDTEIYQKMCERINNWWEKEGKERQLKIKV